MEVMKSVGKMTSACGTFPSSFLICFVFLCVPHVQLSGIPGQHNNDMLCVFLFYRTCSHSLTSGMVFVGCVSAAGFHLSRR